MVVLSSHECDPAQNFALYHLGMVPGEMVLKGFAKPWIFMMLGDQNAKKTLKFRMNMVRFGFPELSTLAK